MLFTSIRLFNFDTQREAQKFPTVIIGINYRTVAVLTSEIRRHQSFLQSRPKCKIFNTDNLEV